MGSRASSDQERPPKFDTTEAEADKQVSFPHRPDSQSQDHIPNDEGYNTEHSRQEMDVDASIDRNCDKPDLHKSLSNDISSNGMESPSRNDSRCT